HAAPVGLLLVVVLHFGEFRIDHTIRRAVGAGVATGRLGTGLLRLDRGKQRLRRFFQSLALGLDLALVVALHRGLDIGDRRLGRTDPLTRQLLAVFLDRGARRVDQTIGLLAR